MPSSTSGHISRSVQVRNSGFKSSKRSNMKSNLMSKKVVEKTEKQYNKKNKASKKDSSQMQILLDENQS
jgi:hypothetical protein